ncbi:MAG: helix-turn-helix transcriptional regulator [Pseudomonadota bacterium]
MPHQVDIHVGKRIRQRRWLVGITQQQLAEAVGIKFQQIQKYETGSNRVSASPLWQIAETLQVPVTFFFDEMEDLSADPAAQIAPVPGNVTEDREAMELIRTYYAIPETQRRRLFELARVLGDTA